MSSSLDQQFPQRSAAFYDIKNGTLTPTAYALMRSLWERTGGGSAPITTPELEAKVDFLTAQVALLSSQVATLTTAVTTLSGTVTALSNTVTNLSNTVNLLANTVSNNAAQAAMGDVL